MENIGLVKAKGKNDGKWVEGYLVPICKNTRPDGYAIIEKDGINYDELDGYQPSFCSHEIDPETICRYTGITDEKSGKKIWEHDVVKYHFGDDVAEIKFGEYQSPFDSQKTCHVGFYVDWQKGYLRKDLGYWVKMIDCNIVGNSIDNPELLEVDHG